MGFDKLKVYVPQDGPYGLEPEEGGEPVEEETCYLKSDVDAVIAELKDERDAFEKSLNEMTEAFMQSQCALWLARAKRAFAEYFFWNHIAFDKKYAKNKFTISHSNTTNSKSNKISRTPREWSDIWYDVEFKCNAYADKLAKEYK